MGFRNSTIPKDYLLRLVLPKMDNDGGSEPCGKGTSQLCDHIIITNTFTTKACGEVFKIQGRPLCCKFKVGPFNSTSPKDYILRLVLPKMDNDEGSEPCGKGTCQLCDHIIITNTFTTKACGEVFKIQGRPLCCKFKVGPFNSTSPKDYILRLVLPKMDYDESSEPCGKGTCQVCDHIITTNIFTCGEVFKIQSRPLHCH